MTNRKRRTFFSGKKGARFFAKRFVHRGEKNRGGGFTLIEVLLASVAASLVLATIYGVFTNAVRMRDKATIRTHNAQLRQRAGLVIRNDLQNAYVSGGVLASVLQGSANGPEPSFPGYLTFTTTTGRDTPDEMRGDVQQISYYIVTDENNPSRDAGMLIREVNRNLLATNQTNTSREEQILPNVASMDISFYDGTNWNSTWTYTPGVSQQNAASTNTSVLPVAVRVRITQVAPSDKVPAPPPLEILALLTAQPLTSSTNATTSGTTSTTTTSTSSTSSSSTTDEEDETVPEQQEGEIAGEPGVMEGTEGENTTSSGQSSTGSTTQ